MRGRHAIEGVGAAALALAAAAWWWRRHPSACPYGQRFWVQAPHPFITRARLKEALDPRPGERELFGDPHWVSPSALRTRAQRAGLVPDTRLGGPLGYFARFAVS